MRWRNGIWCNLKTVMHCKNQNLPILGSLLQWRWQWASIGHFVFLFIQYHLVLGFIYKCNRPRKRHISWHIFFWLAQKSTVIKWLILVWKIRTCMGQHLGGKKEFCQLCRVTCIVIGWIWISRSKHCEVENSECGVMQFFYCNSA